MIDPAFLSSLRGRLRPELLLTMVQLEQRVPGWWANQRELARDLGLGRDTLNKNLSRLVLEGLVAASAHANTKGTWIYWVKRSADDKPDPALEPAYVIRDLKTRMRQRIPVDQRRTWARRWGIPYPTFLAFLNGRQKVLRGRWEMVGGPYDLGDLEEP